MPSRINNSQQTRLILQTLLASKEPLWTGEITAKNDLIWDSTDRVLKRLERAGWLVSAKETPELASIRKTGMRRYWALTDEGRISAAQQLERAVSPSRARRSSVSQDADLGL